jgi:ABC-2 type transport system ATP-binding protein
VTLVIDQLTKRFGSVVALDRASFSVKTGEVYGYLGANGAGKTTTMRIVLGILRPDEGAVLWRGRSTRELARRTWGYLPEERGLYARMRVLDQLVFFAGLYGIAHDEARANAGAWLQRFRISDYANRRADELSKGNQQKVQFIAAVLHEPEVLLMDEPFTGLDPLNVALLREALLELRDAGRTIIFSTHQMELVELLCDSIAIVDRGRIVASGTVGDVKRASGRRVVRLAVEGAAAAAWLSGLEGARVTRTGGDGLEVSLPSDGDPNAILAQAVARDARVTHFEVTEPTVEELFVQLVGHSPEDEDRHLADLATLDALTRPESRSGTGRDADIPAARATGRSRP